MSLNVTWYNIIALKKHGIVVSIANGKFACVDLREYFFCRNIIWCVCIFRKNIIWCVCLFRKNIIWCVCIFRKNIIWSAPFYNFHEFIVFECSNGFWLSVEKNEKHVVLQISKERDDIISYKDGVEHTRDSGIVLRAKSPVKRRGRNGVFRVKDLLAEVIGTAAYNLITSNCHHFAGQMMNTYARDPVGCTGEKKAD